MVIRTGLARKPWTNYKTANYCIAYLDILGAKDKICNDKDFEFLNHLNMFMEDAIQESGNGIFPRKEEIFIKIFSDNILLAIELKENDEQRDHKIAALFNTVANIYNEILRYGHLMRGAIVEGEFFHNDLIVYGKGLVEAVKNLLNNVHYLNNPICFNDPYDSKICYYFNDVLYDITKLHIENSMDLSSIIQKNIIKLLDKGFDIFQIYKKYRSNLDVREEREFIIENIQDNIEELHMNKLNDYITNYIKITCFSETKDNILMWAHYAKNHTGFCIEYDLTSPEFDDFKKELYPVFYTNKPFKRFEKYDDITTYSFHLLTFLTKYKDWSYEREWRYIQLRNNNSFIKMPTKPSCVYLGAKFDSENHKIISDICKFKKIPCHKMFMRADKFYVQPSICYS